MFIAHPAVRTSHRRPKWEQLQQRSERLHCDAITNHIHHLAGVLYFVSILPGCDSRVAFHGRRGRANRQASLGLQLRDAYSCYTWSRVLLRRPRG